MHSRLTQGAVLFPQLYETSPAVNINRNENLQNQIRIMEYLTCHSHKAGVLLCDDILDDTGMVAAKSSPQVSE